MNFPGNLNGRVIHLIIVTVFSLFCPAGLSAQDKFELEKRGGHYYFTATVNDTPVELMLESGVPALLVGRSVYESCLESSDLAFQSSKQNIRLLNNLYDIVFKAEGEVRIAGIIYDGPIFILEGYEGASVPVQYLKDPVSRRAILTIDLKNNYMRVGDVQDVSIKKKYKLSFDENLGFPVVTGTIRLDTPEGRAKLKGGLIVDFGNPSLLFLMKQHKSLSKAIGKGTIGLKDAFDRQGNLVAQGIYALAVSMFGQTHHDISIGVTDKMKKIEQLGFLGTPFFTSPVVFDFDRGMMCLVTFL
jgi:hypothetical protein